MTFENQYQLINEEEFNFVSYRNERGKYSTRRRKFHLSGRFCFLSFRQKKKNYVWINGSAHFDRFLVKRTTGSQGCNFVEILCSVLRQSRVTKLEYKLEFD